MRNTKFTCVRRRHRRRVRSGICALLLVFVYV